LLCSRSRTVGGSASIAKGETGWFEFFYVEMWADWPPMRKQLKPKRQSQNRPAAAAQGGCTQAGCGDETGRVGRAGSGKRQMPAAGAAAWRPLVAAVVRPQCVLLAGSAHLRALPSSKQARLCVDCARCQRIRLRSSTRCLATSPSRERGRQATDVVDAIDEAIADKASAKRLDTLRKPKAGGGTGSRRPPTRRKEGRHRGQGGHVGV
jgi:hypothetical protein